jgi:hypothetical protein
MKSYRRFSSTRVLQNGGFSEVIERLVILLNFCAKFEHLCFKFPNFAKLQTVSKHFSFGEISTNNDRIMWSKDIFNSTGKTERNNPDISSLFFKQGVLNKVTYTIHDPNTLVEFYS